MASDTEATRPSSEPLVEQEKPAPSDDYPKTNDGTKH